MSSGAKDHGESNTPLRSRDFDSPAGTETDGTAVKALKMRKHHQTRKFLAPYPSSRMTSDKSQCLKRATGRGIGRMCCSQRSILLFTLAACFADQTAALVAGGGLVCGNSMRSPRYASRGYLQVTGARSSSARSSLHGLCASMGNHEKHVGNPQPQKHQFIDERRIFSRRYTAKMVKFAQTFLSSFYDGVFDPSLTSKDFSFDTSVIDLKRAQFYGFSLNPFEPKQIHFIARTRTKDVYSCSLTLDADGLVDRFIPVDVDYNSRAPSSLSSPLPLSTISAIDTTTGTTDAPQVVHLQQEITRLRSKLVQQKQEADDELADLRECTTLCLPH